MRSTAASSGTDLNAMAALDACNQIKARMSAHAARIYEVEPTDVRWEFGGLRAGQQLIAFGELATSCWMNRVQLLAAGFYATPKLHWDRATGKVRPCYYCAYGASCSEVTIDTLTGEYQIDRSDVIEDVGRSLNPAIDIGQVEGGFIQGVGWLTTEELWWDGKGQLRTHAPSTYKIPGSRDVPPVLNVHLLDRPQAEETVLRSKPVGEPPPMLAISVWLATPDDGLGRPRPLSFRCLVDAASPLVIFTVPRLEYWNLVILVPEAQNDMTPGRGSRKGKIRPSS